MGWQPTVIEQIFEDLAKSSDKFAKSLQGVATAGKSASAIKVMDKAIEYQKEIAKNANNKDALAELLKAVAPKEGAGGEQIIKLELDGTRLGTWVMDHWKKEARRV